MDGAKKYQIFVSSTYKDMVEERQAAVEAILTAGHIPAGMELFAAGDQSQLEVIKRWIDDSDIYLLILGGRYGSIEPVSGDSYTEVEYDYAVNSGKPYFALVLTDGAVASKQNESDPAVRAKLATFKEKVLGKMSRHVDDCKDIKIHLPIAIRDIEGRHELNGWVRASEVAQPQVVADMLSEVTSLRAERNALKARLQEAQAAVPIIPMGGQLDANR